MDFSTKWVVGMVGLPNRGKTYMSRKLARYLCWLGHDAQVFNVTQYRAELMNRNSESNSDDEFFDYSKFNSDAALEATADLAEYLNTQGGIAIYDGLNITQKERKQFETEIASRLSCDYNLIWVESWWDDKEVLINNFKTTRENYEEYQSMTDEQVFEVFEEKIEDLKDQYETLNKDVEKSFIKIINMGKSIELVKVDSIRFTNIIMFLCGLKAYARPIYFSRHGESIFNTMELIGGDSLLSENGLKYGAWLRNFFLNQGENLDEMKKYCSTLKRTQQTVSFLDGIGKGDPVVKKELDEIDAGIWDSLTYEQINEKFPREYDMRLEDKLNYRYPRGESYLDVIRRLEPFIFELESCSKPVFIVSHQATLRCLYSYFEAQKVDTIPYIKVPLHTLIKLETGILGLTQTTYTFDIETGEYSTEVKKVNYQNDLPKRMRFRTTDSDLDSEGDSVKD